MQQRSIALLKKIDSIVYQVLEKFVDLFDKAIIQDKAKELLATDNVAMEYDALTIIRLCKDLLGVTRGLRETWCMETIKVNPEESFDEAIQEDETTEVFEKFNELIDRIAMLEKSNS